MTNTVHHTGYLDALIEKGITFLLIFTPLAIGTVQQWSIAVMETTAFLILFAWLLKSAYDPASSPFKNRPDVRSLSAWIFIFPLVLAGITLFQIIPLPPSVLRFISPGTTSFYQHFANDPPGAWRTISLYPHATADQLLKLLSYGAVFIVIISHYDSPAKIKGVFRTIIIMGCSLAVFAVIQKATWNGNLYWVFPLREGAHPFGPYINKNHFAGYMEMAAPLGLGFYLYTVSKMSGTNDQEMPFQERLASFLKNKNLMDVSFGLIAVVILSGALFMTLSRGAVTGFAVSMILLIGLARSRRSLRKHSAFMTLAGLIIFFAVVISGWSMLEKRFEELGKGETARFDVWPDALSLAWDYPLVGTGLGTFKRVFPGYQTKRSQLLFEHAENEYVEILTETGMIGLAATLGGISIFFASILRQWRRRHNSFVISLAAGGITSCVAIAIHGFIDFNMRVPANAMLLTIIAAGTYAMVYNVRSERHSQMLSPK